MNAQEFPIIDAAMELSDLHRAEMKQELRASVSKYIAADSKPVSTQARSISGTCQTLRQNSSGLQGL